MVIHVCLDGLSLPYCQKLKSYIGGHGAKVKVALPDGQVSKQRIYGEDSVHPIRAVKVAN